MNISVKKNQNIPNETEIIVNFIFSHYKSMGTLSCHYKQPEFLSDWNKKHNFSFPLPIDANVKYEKNRQHSFRGDVV